MVAVWLPPLLHCPSAMAVVVSIGVVIAGVAVGFVISPASRLELQMVPMRRTTSGHKIVWMSSCGRRCWSMNGVTTQMECARLPINLPHQTSPLQLDLFRSN
jgi:hypothetical protein